MNWLITLARANGLMVPDDVRIVHTQKRYIDAACPLLEVQHIDKDGMLPDRAIIETERVDTAQCASTIHIGYGPKSNILAVRGEPCVTE